MPANVQIASPSTVLPRMLCRAFRQTREHRCLINEYPDGSTQRRTTTDTSRRSWELQARLTAAENTALTNFYLARKGPAEAFYFYDPYETTVVGAWDGSGATTTGRYTVRFEGALSIEQTVGRATATLKLVEVG